MDFDSFLVALYVLVDDRWQAAHPPSRRGRGRPATLSESEVLTLAILAQWPRWRSERDFWRFADAHLRSYFPNLVSQSQLNRRARALEPELQALQGDLAATLTAPQEAYHILDTTLIPAVVRARAPSQGPLCRSGCLRPQRVQDRMGVRFQGSTVRDLRRGRRCLRSGPGELR